MKDSSTKTSTTPCDTCIDHRTICSENGYHAICCRTSKEAVACITENYKHYYRHPFYREVCDQ